MFVKYDRLNRHEPLLLTLCNPGSVYNNDRHVPDKIVGMMPDVSDIELCANFNQVSELNFRYTLAHRDVQQEDEFVVSIFSAIQPRRLIFITGIGYFVIKSVKCGVSEDGSSYKDVSAESIESELSNTKVPYIKDGTYKFVGQVGETRGMLDSIMESAPLWGLGHVDESVGSKYRTFEDIDNNMNLLAFMIEKMEDAYECIFVFDVINRIINVYDQNNYVRRTDIHLTPEDLIKTVDVSENTDTLYTAISVMGDDNVTISAINPLGGNTIYRFDHYLSWMSPGLASKVSTWEALIQTKLSPYYDLNLSMYNKLGEKYRLESEVSRIDIQLTMYRRCRDNIVAESNTDLVSSYNKAIGENGGTEITIKDSVAETLAEIDSLISAAEANLSTVSGQISVLSAGIDALTADIQAIRDAVAINSYFTEDERAELVNFIFEGSYKDEYVTITDNMTYEDKFGQMKVLYDRAWDTLLKASKPTQEIHIDVENFVFDQRFEHWSEQLETGCLINVELAQDDVAMMFVSNMTINYEDNTMSLTLGNRFNKFDPKTLFDKVLGNISKSANTLSHIRETVYPIKSGEFNQMQDALDASRNLTMQGAFESSNEDVVIDESGYTGKKRLENGTYDPRQVKIVGKNIILTDDAWKTCKVAIGEINLGNDDVVYGVNANVLIGDLIIGNKLHIIDKNGNDIFTVFDGLVDSKVQNLENDITEMRQDSDSLELRIGQVEEDARKGVSSVRTKTGFVFDENGMNISQDGSEMQNLLDSTGMYVRRSGTDILKANNEGVDAINLTSRQYLIVGENSRFENYSDGTDTHRTACFFIGGE